MIEVKNLLVKAGSFVVDVEDLRIEHSEYCVVMGPSGAGKTILLETIAGFREPTRGSILVNGRDVTKFPPEKRNLAYVPQNYALWPHMTVFENIAYGLRARKIPNEEIKRRVLEIAEIMEIKDLLNRRPITLSGGEQQRVTLARALVIEPNAVLLDEPLSSLDEKTKDQIKAFIKRLHKKLKFTAIHVTHDPIEAAELGRKIAVMIGGKIIQVGSVREIFTRPKTPDVAWLHGKPNLLEGEIVEVKEDVIRIKVNDFTITATKENGYEIGSRVLVILRPEDIILSKQPMKTSARNVFECKIEEIEERGPLVYVVLAREDFRLYALITRGAYEELELKSCSRIYASFKATAVKVRSLSK